MKHNFIDIYDFCNKYSLNKKSFESMKARGYYPSRVFKKDGNELRVDEVFFIQKKKKSKRLWLKAHENYFVLIENKSEFKLSKILHNIDNSKSINSWTMFLYENLFSLQVESILNSNVSKSLYLFLRYSNWIIRRGI